MRLREKVAIITGGGRGIGSATAKMFASEGAKVVVADLNKEDIDLTVKELEKITPDVLGVKVNVTNRDEIKKVVDQTVEQFGSIDILVNNAGITNDAQVLKMTDEQMDQVLDVNVKGVFKFTQEVLPIMKEQQSGVILNASSVVGLYGNFGQTNYAASKWGVNGMTKSWAKELGRYGIRVNAIAPGFILTPMTEKMPEKVLNFMKDKSVLKKLGTPEDIASGYTFLASDEAKYITGTILSIDGGVVI